MKRGEVWRVRIPALAEAQPVLVVSIDAVNDLTPVTLVVPITTRGGALRPALPADASTGLAAPAFADCARVGPLTRDRFDARLGALPPPAWPSIEAALRRVLGLRT